MRDRETEELLRLIGQERDSTSPDVVAAAEEELARRAEGKEKTSVRRAKTVGRVCAVIGLPLSLFSLLFVVLSVDPPTNSSGIIFGNWALATGVVGLMQFVVGMLLFLGGLRFRRLEDRGRKQLLLALRILQVYIVVFSIVIVVDASLEPATWPVGILFAVAAIASGAFYYWLLQLAARYFWSSAIRGICERPAAAA